MSETGQRDWEIYEEVAGQLLGKLGAALGLELERMEEKQTLPGESGTEWEIDRVGIMKGGGKVVAIGAGFIGKGILSATTVAVPQPDQS